MLKILVLSLFSVASFAGGTVVKDVKTYEQAAVEACEGQQLGASCTIMFPGGSFTVGVCIKLPDSPVGSGQLSCQIDTANLPGCAKKVAAAHAANQSLKK